MPKTAVVYKSKYGSTKKYAKWIADEANADLFEVSKVRAESLIPYDTIVYGGGLYAGCILGFSVMKKNYKKLSDKKLIVFAVGATPKHEDVAKEVKNKNLPPEMQERVRFFLLRGGLNYTKMNLLDRLMMYFLVKSIKAKDPNELDNDSKDVLATYGKVIDYTDKNTIKPIIECINNI